MELKESVTLGISILTFVSVIGGFGFTWGKQTANQANTDQRLEKIENRFDNDVFIKRVEFDKEIAHIQIKLNELTRHREGE